MIQAQPVVQKKRVIKNNQQHYIEEDHQLELHTSAVVTPEETILLDYLFDVSYKKFSAVYGLLYLHTNSGIRTFMVRESPEQWMDTVRSSLKKKSGS